MGDQLETPEDFQEYILCTGLTPRHQQGRGGQTRLAAEAGPHVAARSTSVLETHWGWFPDADLSPSPSEWWGRGSDTRGLPSCLLWVGVGQSLFKAFS